MGEGSAVTFREVWVGRLDIEALSGLLVKEVKHVLKDIAWRKVREGWGEEARGWPKLELI